MPSTKRRLLSDTADSDCIPNKRQRTAPPRSTTPPQSASASRDLFARLSDEIFIRILSYMNPRALLDISLVSKRFHAVASDSQLWRPHYYHRFVQPRVQLIPGFKTREASDAKRSAPRSDAATWRKPASTKRWNAAREQVVDFVDWKKQYRLRHNWAGGRCAVEQVEVRALDDKMAAVAPPEWQTLVKVVEGIAVTADAVSGLRAWDLRTRQTIAQASLKAELSTRLRPTCLAVDDARLGRGQVDVAVGFEDGTSGVWRLDAHRNTMRLLFRQEKGFLGSLLSIAYGYPYLLTATKLGFIALYTFNNLTTENISEAGDDTDNEAAPEAATQSPDDADDEHVTLPPPYLLTSLKSHNTEGPLSLSLRKNASSVVASIAYTFNTVGGWSIGIQDLDIRPSGAVTSRVATSLPTRLGSSCPSPSSSPLQPISYLFDTADDETGPVKLRYSHPYLLATLPDNTLVLHLCTATPTSLTISSGVRLWGHTSGISDAEITPRGKAVSVSTRGDEIRLWDLEGRCNARSVAVRPRRREGNDTGSSTDQSPAGSAPRTPTRMNMDDERRNWVGFDDEVVLVLKEAINGRDSLTLYDFT
ncbi:F-box domain containing protein [Cordyceps militaris CM01]|uniref:F-box domain containing protein n=1 Tax=Cordyceps militaris (strain CM01) TaxID=983644 RepID=G3JRI7_CORMM|nr:F-box domain containing protein [Cordyceps militaris CM01]EGX88590.1 F-box domain containing protein [Cordyceps militaris CM01]